MSSDPWNDDVRGTQVKPLINIDEQTIRVQAGPGTGKTFGLVRRVVRLVHPSGQNIHGSDVLVVAFNRIIAAQLRTEINNALDGNDPAIHPPRVLTVHGLCLEMLGDSVRLLLPHEREAMIYDVLGLDATLDSQFDYNSAEQALKDHEAGTPSPLLWQTVEAWLLRHNAKLISDVPGHVIAKIQGGDLTSPRFKHIIVDEFQDLTPKEQQLVFRLLKPNGTLVALGDSRQSIYHFRGNDRDGLAKLEQLSGGPVHDIAMTECQRCPASVVKAANELMVRSTAAPMVPGSTAAANLHVVWWKTPDAEAKGMANAIFRNYQAFPSERHLVMVTRKDFGFLLRDELRKLNPDLCVNLCFQEGILNSWAAREAFIFFCLIVDPDPATWRAWLGYRNSTTGEDSKPLERNSGAYLKLFTDGSDAITEAVLQAYISRPRQSGDGTGSTSLRGRISRYFELKTSFSSLDLSDPESAIAQLLDASTWISSGYAQDKVPAAEADLEVLLSAAYESLTEAEHEPNPAANLREIARSLRRQIATRDIAALDQPECIQVSTLWGAKGVTAEHVYVLGLCNEAIPGTRRSTYRGTDMEYSEEQRRLFYVSLTRSKSTLVLSRAKRVRFGDAKKLGLTVVSSGSAWSDLVMCSFLRDIMSHLPTAVDGTSWGGC